MRLVSRLSVAGLAATCLLLLAVGLAGARASQDLRGTWNCCGAGGAARQTWKITSMNLSTGRFAGRGSGNGYTFPVTGRLIGSSVTGTTGPYDQLPSYSGTFTGRISANGKTITGSWKSNQHQSGTFTATRKSAPRVPRPVTAARCRVPKLAGDTLAGARRALRRAHCALGKVTRVKSTRVAKGRVVSSQPKAGSRHRRGTRVGLTVSRGRH